MTNKLIDSNEIYLQDVVCTVVAKHKADDDFAIYNMVSSMVEISDIEMAEKILRLIKINKLALMN